MRRTLLLPPAVASPKLARHRFGAAPRDAPKRRSRIIAIATYNKWEGQRSAVVRALLFVHLEKTRICGNVVLPQLLHDRLHLMRNVVFAAREHAA